MTKYHCFYIYFLQEGKALYMRMLISRTYQIIILIVTIVSLNGCSNTFNITESDINDDVVEIEFWYGLSGYPSQLMKEIIDEFNQSQEEVYIIGVTQGSYEETFKAVKSSITRRNSPAVALLEAQHVFYMASKGVLSKLDGFINEDVSLEIDDFIESYLDQTKNKESIIALPVYGATQVLYYRRDLFEQHDIMFIDLITWEGLAEVARKLTKKQGEEVLVYGWEPMYGMENLIDAAISKGGSFLSDDGKTVMIDSTEWIDAWEFFRKLIHEEEVMKVHYGGESWEHWYATIDDVMLGRAAGYIGSSGDQGDIDFETIGSYILPSWEGQVNNPRGVVNLQALCIPESVSEDEKKAAYKWIRYLTDAKVNLNWSLKTGYLPVRKSSMDMDEFYDYVIENPDYFVPIKQIKMGTKIFIDPTDGKIYDALMEAADKLQIQNVPAAIALAEAKKKAQRELDEMLNQGR